MASTNSERAIRFENPLYSSNERRCTEGIQVVLLSLDENRIQKIEEIDERSHVGKVSGGVEVKDQRLTETQQIMENVHTLVEHADDHVRVVVNSLEKIGGIRIHINVTVSLLRVLSEVQSDPLVKVHKKIGVLRLQ